METLPEDIMMEKKRITQKKKKKKPKLKRKKMIDRFLNQEEDVMRIEKPEAKRKKMIDRDMEKQLLPEEEDVLIEKIFLNLPEDVIEKILLKLPANSLSNFRYVSNYLWSLITNPSFVKSHLQNSTTTAQINNHLLLISSHRRSLCKYKDGSLGPEHINHNYACNFTTNSRISSPEIVEMHCPFESTEIRDSCNGLLYLHRRVIDDEGYVDILNYIWNPCTKEYKELPPPPPPVLPLSDDDENYVTDLSYTSWPFASSSGFCGFGYDRTNDQYKILHYENLVDPGYIVRGLFHAVTHVSSMVEFKLYTLGKNTWTSIVDNPYKSFFFREPCRRIGLLVNGALHWIMCLSNPKSKGKIVSFDFVKEVFGEVQKPQYYFREEEEEDQQHYHESLQVLQECLCMCKYHYNREVRKIDIWMLQDYDVMDSWTKLFRVVMPYDDYGFSLRHFTLLRYCENGEILMLRNEKDMIIYDPLNHKARRATKFNESIEELWLYYMVYTESIVPLNSGTYTSS